MPKGDDPLVRLARSYVRQRRRGIDPRPPESRYENTPFGRVRFGLSGSDEKHEKSVSGQRVNLIYQGRTAERYEDMSGAITKRVAAGVLTALIQDLDDHKRKTGSRTAWLNDHPGAMSTVGWSKPEMEAAALLYATTKYSEEQRTHGGKQMRAALRSVAKGPTTGKQAFGPTGYLVPQAKSIIDLRAVVDDWFAQREKANPKGRAKTQKFGDISESSEDEAERKGRPKKLKTDLEVMTAYREGITAPKAREVTTLNVYFDAVQSAAYESASALVPNADEDVVMEDAPDPLGRATTAPKLAGPAKRGRSRSAGAALKKPQRPRKKPRVTARKRRAEDEPVSISPAKRQRLSKGRTGWYRPEPDTLKD